MFEIVSLLTFYSQLPDVLLTLVSCSYRLNLNIKTKESKSEIKFSASALKQESETRMTASFLISSVILNLLSVSL